MALRFATKPNPSEPGQLDNFGNIRKDGSRQPLSGSPGNGFQTVDAAGTPLVSPLALTTTLTAITVPLNASTITLVGTGLFTISEQSPATSGSFTVPVGAVVTIDVANQLNFYIAAATTATVSFFFQIV